jgi:hypothetical protein
VVNNDDLTLADQPPSPNPPNVNGEAIINPTDKEAPVNQLVGLIKDISLGLVQISGLLLGLNFAFINYSAPEVLSRIRTYLTLSTASLALSILIGFVLLGFLPEMLQNKRKTLAQVLSFLQAISFAVAIVVTAIAIYVRLHL